MSNPFELEARRSFDGLAQQFGMDCVRSSNREVRYESGNTFLSVNFDDGRSYEVGVEIGQLQLSQPGETLYAGRNTSSQRCGGRCIDRRDDGQRLHFST